MRRGRRKTLAIFVAAGLLLVAMIVEIILVFSVNSQQANESGSNRLEVISGELEQTINDAKTTAMSFAIGAESVSDDKEKLEAFVRRRKKDLSEQTDGVCYNAYIAGDGWSYIPDFDAPDDYNVNERGWYLGAVEHPRTAYVTDPYVDAATGHICYTVSVALDDGETVVALDYTMENIRHHVERMYSDYDDKTAMIVTEKGVIAGCTTQDMVGKSMLEEMPEYAGIFTLAKNAEGTVHVRRRGNNLFGVRSNFGWYLIVSENNWSLYRNSYIQMLAMIAFSLVIIGIMVIMYLSTARSAKRAEEIVENNRDFLAGLTTGLQEPLHRILAGASPENVRTAVSYEQEFENIREAGSKLNEMIGKIVSYNSIIRTQDNKKKQKAGKRELTIDKHFRRLIIIALMLVFVMSMYVNVTATLRGGKGTMKEDLNKYDTKLSSWMTAQKSKLDMFSSMISIDSDMINDYEGTVKFLDDITKQYPEISASYITNPSWEHAVIMNTGWEPDSDLNIEEREWYKQLEASEEGWIISSPYYDVQTGAYCVTLAEKVFDSKTGEYIGNFGIDFYMDKLSDILGGSFSDNSYAFLTGPDGSILDHPYGSYRLNRQSVTNVAELPYSSVETNGEDVALIVDYDGALRAVIASDTNEAGFSVYVVKNIMSVYGSVLVYGMICLAVLLGCTIAVYMLMNNLIDLQNRANKQLKNSADAAIAADEAKSTFLAQMSHEIRTPINAVLGMNEMILRESDDDTIKEYAENIRSAGRTLLSLINSILDFSKIEDGKMEILPVSYGTASLINDLVTSVSARAADKDLEFIVKADPTLPAKMIGDDVRIKQVISNLLTNAVKYTEKGSVTLTIHPENIDGDRLDLYVEVGDTGIGIKDEDIDSLFESFRRLDEKRNRNIEGTGLGMSIVTKLLEMMDSELHVESIYGVGSTFWFRLPQTISDHAEMGEYSHKSILREKNDGEKHIYAPDAKVLVVDDNEMNIKVAVSLLKLYGIVPETASSGYMALSMIREKRYDVILLDHMMPGMDGIETLNRVTSEGMRDADTAMIALTANAVVGARDSYLAAGFDDYLTKPIESALLEKMLQKYLPESMVTMVEGEPKGLTEQAAPDRFTVEELQRICELCRGINPVVGMEYCMGSKEFYLDTLEGFVEADKRKQLSQAYEKEDLENYRITVHGIKSTALTIGAQLMSDHAKMLEFAARDQDIDYIVQKHNDLEDEYKLLLGGVRAIIAEFKEKSKEKK